MARRDAPVGPCFQQQFSGRCEEPHGEGLPTTRGSQGPPGGSTFTDVPSGSMDRARMCKQKPGPVLHTSAGRAARGEGGPFTDHSRSRFKKSPSSRSLTLILVSLFGSLEFTKQTRREQARFPLPDTYDQRAQTQQRGNLHAALHNEAAALTRWVFKWD